MAKFKSGLQDARRAAESDYQLAYKAASSRNSGQLAILGSNGVAAANIESRDRQRVFDAREQYAHFRGQAFTSIRPIAQRIAGQKIRMAFVASKGAGRSKGEPETKAFDCDAPSWVKSLTLKSTDELRLVESHPALEALANPAPEVPFLNDWLLVYCLVASLETTGAGFLWARQVGNSRDVWYLPAHWVRPVHGATLYQSYELLPDGIESPISLERDEIVPFVLADPAHPLSPLGPLEAGAKEILTNEHVIDAQKVTFERGVHPSAIIKIAKGEDSQGRSRGARLREYQREQVIQALNRRYRGMLHFGEPMILDGRVESMEPYGNKPNELSFGENGSSSKSRVEQLFGTNPYVVGAAGMGSRAESAESDAHFCYTTCNPLVELISRVLTRSYVPLFDKSGKYIMFIEPTRPRDSEMEQKEWEVGLKYGAVTLDEYRQQVLRLKPLENGAGKTALVQTNFAYVQPGGTVPTPPKPDAPQGEGAGKSQRLRLTTKAIDDSFYDTYAETWIKSHEANETNMHDAVEAFFKSQGADVTTKLEAALGDDSKTSYADAILASVFQPSDWVSKFRDSIAPAFAYAAAAGATHELSAFSDWSGKPLPAPADAPTAGKGRKDVASIDFDGFGVDWPPDMLASIKAAVDSALAKDYWSEIQQTTKDALADSLKAGIEAGEDMRAIMKRVKDDVFGGDVVTARAKNIARSETTHALNAGQDVARKQLAEEGIVSGKEWFATFDGKTRAAHLNANGQVKGVDEQFDVGGYPAKYPGDPDLPASQRCSCRCIASSVTVFSKRTRAPQVKTEAILANSCEIHA